MMRLSSPPKRVRALRLAALFAFAQMGAGACGGPDTILVVSVEGNAPAAIHQFAVEVVVGESRRSLSVPGSPTADPIALPTNFSVQIPRSTGGALQVTVVALDETGAEIARGMAATLALGGGSRNEVTVVLGSMNGVADGGTMDGGTMDAPPTVPPDASLDVAVADKASVADATADAPADVAAEVDAAVDQAVDARLADTVPVDAASADALSSTDQATGSSNDARDAGIQ